MTRPNEVIIAALATALHLTYEICDEDPGRADAVRELVAAARTACDALVAEVRRLRAVAESAAEFFMRVADPSEIVAASDATQEQVASFYQAEKALRAAGYLPDEKGGQ